MTDHYDCPRCSEWVPLTEMWCPECNAPLTVEAELMFRAESTSATLGPRLFTCPVCLHDNQEPLCGCCGRPLSEHDFDNNSGAGQTSPRDSSPAPQEVPV